MARLWQCGFELNSTTTGMEFTTSSGTVSIQTSTVRTGTYALRANPTSSTGFARWHAFASDQAIVGYQRFYLNITTLPSAATSICRFLDATNNSQGAIRLSTGGALQLLTAGGSQIGSSSTTLSTGTWYMVELKTDATGSGTLDARLDGSSFASGANSAQGNWSRILIGVIGTNATTDLFFDDWALNDASGSNQTSWPGAGKILHLNPNGDGDNHAWANTANGAGSSTNYTLVNQIPPDDTTTLVQSVTLNAEDMYTLSDSGIGASDTVNVVMVGARMRDNSADATTAAKLQIKKVTGGTIAQGSAVVPNTASFFTNAPAEPRYYSLVTYADPDSSAWTQSTLDSAQAGIKLTTAGTNRIQLSALWVSVDYTPSTNTPVSSSDTGAGADAESVSAAVAATETGAGADATAISATTSSAETGAGADAGAVTATVTSADTAAGVDTASLGVIPGSETGSGTDTATVTAQISASDTGAGDEVGTPSSDTAASSGDTGAGADAGSLTAATSDGDTGSGVDAATITASVSSSDTGSGADTESVAQSASISSGDTGTGADSTSLTVAASASDTATGVDAGAVSATFSGADTSAGTDAGSVSAGLSSGESVSGLEAQSVSAGVTADDPGAGVETAAITVFTADTASAVDSGSVSASLSNSDVGTGTDAGSVSVTITQADTGSGADTQSVDQDSFPVSASDTASGVDTQSVSVTISSGDLGSADDATTDRTLSATELGSGSDSAVLNAVLSDGDVASAVSAEAVQVDPEVGDDVSTTDVIADLSVSLTVSDTATGVDSESLTGDDGINMSDGDTAGTSETAAIIIQIANDDAAVSVEGNAVFAALLVSDALAGTEDPARLSLNASDTASSVELASPLASLSVSESATGADANDGPQVSISVLDIATGVDSLSSLNVSLSSGDAGAGAETFPASGATLGSNDAASVSDLSGVNASLTNADAATSVTQTAAVIAAAQAGDSATAAENNSLFIDNLFELDAEDQASGIDFASLMLGVGDQALALDFAHLDLGVSDQASILDFANVILGVFSSDGISAVETAKSNVVRMSDDPVGIAETSLVSVTTSSADTVQTMDSASVFIKSTRSHRVMPYYIREPQAWAIEQERRRHNEALWYIGENTMFVLMWHLDDFLDNLVGRCPTCYESQGRISNVYGQSDEYKCPDCFGTTFEGGFKALIVRPAIFSDSDEGETRQARGVVHPQDLTIESTPDFRVRTGDYCFRVTGDRYYMRVPERITLRTGFGWANQTDTAIGYNHANAAVEDPDSVAYMIPPSNDEVSQILSRTSRIPRDWSTFEVIRAPLIPSSDLIGG